MSEDHPKNQSMAEPGNNRQRVGFDMPNGLVAFEGQSVDDDGTAFKVITDAAFDPAEPGAETTVTVGRESFVQIQNPRTRRWSKLSCRTGRTVAMKDKPDVMFDGIPIYSKTGERPYGAEPGEPLEQPGVALITEEMRVVEVGFGSSAPYARFRSPGRTVGEVFMALQPHHNAMVAAWASSPDLALAVGPVESAWQAYCRARADWIKTGTELHRLITLKAYSVWVREFVTEPSRGETLNQTIAGLIAVCDARLKNAKSTILSA